MYGVFNVEHRRRGSVMARFEARNMIHVDGKLSLINYYFLKKSKPSQWFAGLIDGGPVTILDFDSMSNHPGWTENTQYEAEGDGTNIALGVYRSNIRAACFPGYALAANTGYTNQNPPSNFYFTATGSIDGILVTNSQAGELDLSGHNAVLWATVYFPQLLTFNNNDQLSVKYTVYLR